ncbi:DNA alkylation repair protein [Ornithinicoccus hortensis]|uniref:3-methyladenine DNA glycosylase AlkD n=1 Tax=Ornithinicoccus hortensis TaxID=82346 RepID=A0A542YMB1_9MICO|nr:DNA alkylation repair protein [Ornithinicoccus hortensis]TQL49181.1 3-methyladenine DNA glycosylase AlkD [Ornithinicoccus hortensis]
MTPRADATGQARAHPHADLVAGIRDALPRAGDPERAAGQQRYMKSAMPYHGLTSPELRATLRPILADPAHRIADRPTWEATVRTLWDGATHREQRYAATALAGHRHYRAWQDRDTLRLYRHLVVTGAWWDHVDDIASHLVGPILRSDHPAVAPLIRDWAHADDLWVRRTAILSQLGAKAATDTALLEDCVAANLVDSPFGGEFFIRKAIGWALREYAKTDPAWVRAALARHGAGLSPLSRREAAKHLP